MASNDFRMGTMTISHACYLFVVRYISCIHHGTGAHVSERSEVRRALCSVPRAYLRCVRKRSFVQATRMYHRGSPCQTAFGYIFIVGTYEVSVTVGQFGWHVGGSPHTITVLAAGTYAPNCNSSITGAVISTAGSTSTVHITARDKYGNYRRTGGDTFILSLRFGPKDLYVRLTLRLHFCAEKVRSLAANCVKRFSAYALCLCLGERRS